MSEHTYTLIAFDVHVFGFYPEDTVNASDYGRMFLYNDSAAAKAALTETIEDMYDMLFSEGTSYSVQDLDAICPTLRKAIHENEMVRVNEHILWRVNNLNWLLNSCKEEGDKGYEMKGRVWFNVGVPAGVDEATFRKEFHNAFTHHIEQRGAGYDDCDAVTSVDLDVAKLS